MLHLTLKKAEAGNYLDAVDASALAGSDDLERLMALAGALRDAGHGARVSYSRKVFIR